LPFGALSGLRWRSVLRGCPIVAEVKPVRMAGTSCQFQGIAERGCAAEGPRYLSALVFRHCRAIGAGRRLELFTRQSMLSLRFARIAMPRQAADPHGYAGQARV
jgi:hypothetical protein